MKKSVCLGISTSMISVLTSRMHPSWEGWVKVLKISLLILLMIYYYYIFHYNLYTL